MRLSAIWICATLAAVNCLGCSPESNPSDKSESAPQNFGGADSNIAEDACALFSYDHYNDLRVVHLDAEGNRDRTERADQDGFYEAVMKVQSIEYLGSRSEDSALLNSALRGTVTKEDTTHAIETLITTSKPWRVRDLAGSSHRLRYRYALVGCVNHENEASVISWGALGSVPNDELEFFIAGLPTTPDGVTSIPDALEPVVRSIRWKRIGCEPVEAQARTSVMPIFEFSDGQEFAASVGSRVEINIRDTPYVLEVFKSYIPTEEGVRCGSLGFMIGKRDIFEKIN